MVDILQKKVYFFLLFKIFIYFCLHEFWNIIYLVLAQLEN